MSLVAGEKEKLVRVNADCDLTGNTSIRMVINPPGALSNKTVNPTIGTVDINKNGVILKANYYVNYLTTATDFPVKGYYSLKLEVDFGGSKTLKSISKSIYVNS